MWKMRGGELHRPYSSAGSHVKDGLRVYDGCEVQSALQGHEIHVMSKILLIIGRFIVGTLGDVSWCAKIGVST